MDRNKNFKGPRNPYRCLVPVQNITFCKTSVPITTTGGMYKVSDSEFDNIVESYEALLNTV